MPKAVQDRNIVGKATPRKTPMLMANMVSAPLGTANGPWTGNPSHTHSIMVLESDSRECMAKKSPPSPTPAKTADPVRPLDGTWSPPLVVTCFVDRKTASTARAKPSLFQPPFPECRIGQIGLLV